MSQLSSINEAKQFSSKESNSVKTTIVSFSDTSNSSLQSKQTLKDVPKLKTMPEILYEEDLPSEQPLPKRSTEEICSGSDCFTFKTLLDPGNAKAYFIGELIPPKKECDKEIYIRLAKEAKIAPVKRIVDSLEKSSIDLQFYGLGAQHIMPLSEAMMNNKSVKEINLAGNVLDLDATYHIGQMLRKNKYLQKLNLQHCMIGPDGAELLGNGLEICDHLVELDLSYNGLGDEGMDLLAIKLGYNISIKNLNLSHNNLTHKSGFSLAEAMEENITLQNLNLSWNHIAEEPGLKQFLTTAAERNESLQKLVISWNTLTGVKIANVIKNFISDHKTLKELDISYNRFESAAENIAIMKGVNSSESLKILNLSYNGLAADAAFALFTNINKQTALKELHLDNVWVKPEFEKLRRELKTQAGLDIVIDGIMGGVDIKGPDMQTLLLKRANFLGNKPKKNKKDFGWFLLRLQQAGTLTPVTKAKFEKYLKEDNIKLDDGMVDEFVKRFKDDKKKVDLNMMFEKYMKLFPNTALPVPKLNKKPKETKEKYNKSKSPKKDDNKLERKLANQKKSGATMDKSLEETTEHNKVSLQSNEILTENVTNEIKSIDKLPDVERPNLNLPEELNAEKTSVVENNEENIIQDDQKIQELNDEKKEDNLSLTTDKTENTAEEGKLEEHTLQAD